MAERFLLVGGSQRDANRVQAALRALRPDAVLVHADSLETLTQALKIEDYATVFIRHTGQVLPDEHSLAALALKLFSRAVVVGDKFTEKLAHGFCRLGAAQYLRIQTLVDYLPGCFPDQRISHQVRELPGAYAEQNLHVSSFRTLLDLLGALVVVLDSNGRIKEFNQACQQLTGYSLAEVHDKHYSMLIPPEQQSQVNLVFNMLVLGSPSNNFQNEWVTKSGDHRLIEWTNSRLQGDEHTDGLILCTGIDITERYLKGVALRESENRFERIFQSNPVAICIALVEERKVVDVNQAFEWLTGYPRAEIIGQPFDEIHQIAQDLNPNLPRKVHNFGKGPQSYQVERQIVNRSHRTLDVLVSVDHIELGGKDAVIMMMLDITERKAAEQKVQGLNEELELRVASRTAELEESNRQLAAEVNQRKNLEVIRERLVNVLWETPDVVAIIDTHERIEYLNRAGRELLHLDSDEDIKLFDIRQACSPEDYETVREGIRQATNGDGIWRGNVTLVSPVNGEKVQLSQVVLVHKNDRGEVESYSTILRDNTRLLNQMQLLEETRQILDRYLEVSPVVIYRAEAKYPYRTVVMTENVTREVGYTPQDYLDEPDFWMKNIHPNDLPHCVAAMNTLNDQKSVQMEYRLLCKDGIYRTILDHTLLMSDPQGRPTEIFGYFQNITARREAEDELRRSEERYRALSEASPDMVYVISREDRYEYVNSETCRRIGVAPEQIIGQPRGAALSALDSSFQSRELALVFVTGQPRYSEMSLKLGDQDAWLGTWLVPMRNRSGEIIAVQGVSRDITRLKQVEVELQRALARERELSDIRAQFISMTSHQFRTPLSAILSSAEMLEHYSERLTPEKRTVHLQRIQQAAQRMNRLLNPILDLGRFDAGKVTLHPQELDAAAFCGQVVDEFKMTGGKHAHIEYQVEGDCRPAFMDQEFLRQILENLLANAVKYSPPDEVIKVNVRCGDEWVDLIVDDNGMGIPQEDLAHVFEPFFRGHNVSTIQGTGLGLTIVYNLVKTMGGEITPQSKQRGACFTAHLPRHQINN